MKKLLHLSFFLLLAENTISSSSQKQSNLSSFTERNIKQIESIDSIEETTKTKIGLETKITAYYKMETYKNEHDEIITHCVYFSPKAYSRSVLETCRTNGDVIEKVTAQDGTVIVYHKDLHGNLRITS